MAWGRGAGARGWRRQEPGRVAHMVRQWQPAHRTCSLEDALRVWAEKHDVPLGTPAPKTIRYLCATWHPRSSSVRPWAVVYPRDPAIGKSFRIGWPPWLGYAWPPAGDECRPPRWPGGDHNKSDNKDNRSKDMAWNAAVTMAADTRPGADEAAVLANEGITLPREQAAVVAVDEAARGLMSAIAVAEGLGLMVQVRQESDSVHSRGELMPRTMTANISVSVMKRLR